MMSAMKAEMLIVALTVLSLIQSQCHICGTVLTLTMWRDLTPAEAEFVTLCVALGILLLFPWEEEAKHVHTNDPNNPACSCYALFLFCTISLHSPHSWHSLGGSVSVPSASWNIIKQSHLKKENAANFIFLPPSIPALFPKFRLAVF